MGVPTADILKAANWSKGCFTMYVSRHKWKSIFFNMDSDAMRHRTRIPRYTRKKAVYHLDQSEDTANVMSTEEPELAAFYSCVTSCLSPLKK